MNNIEKLIQTLLKIHGQYLKIIRMQELVLGRTGVSIPTSHSLAFQLVHAQAQDAVHLPLDVEYVIEQLGKI